MKRLLTAVFAFTAISAGSAEAADLPAQTYTKAPAVTAPVWSWSGFYIGINGGGSVGHSGTTDSQVFGAPGFNSGVPVSLFNESFTHSPVGALPGGQMGYNWQINRFVLGIEGDWQWTSQSDTAVQFGCGNQNFPFFVTAGQGFNNCLHDQQKLDWFATARGRVGVTTGDWLWYATGGGAWGQVKDNLTLQVANTPLVLAPPLNPGTTSASFSHNKAGWTIGAGVETRLWGGLTAKLEYLYVDLGTYSDSFVIPGNAATVPGSTLSTTTLSRFTDHIVRAGLNYKFDWGAPLAKY